jgi:hypothetical protein
MARMLAARRNEARASVAQIGADVFRHRIDWHWLRDGRIEAVLTVSLPDGHQFRFTAQADPKEIAAAIVAQHPEVGGFLGNLWKGVKKVAKSVATSKVFKLAGTALAAVAPALGPLAPLALGAGAGMKAATALVAARSHAAKGNKAAAEKLVTYAKNASKVAATQAPPKAAKKAKSPPKAAAQAHLDTAQSTSAKLYTLLLKPA